MNRLAYTGKSLVAPASTAAAIAALIVLGGATTWAAPNRDTTVSGPDDASARAFAGLRIPDGSVLLFTAQAEGVQIYRATARTGGVSGFEWRLLAPHATLFNNARRPIGTHFAGPTWSGLDGSKVVGSLPARQTLAAPVAGSIPWLLVAIKSHEGVGMLSGVAYVMRVGTAGGVAPLRAPTAAGQETRVKYRATYVFLAAPAPDASVP